MKAENIKPKTHMTKFQKEDILLAIETLQYNNNQKPTIKEVADFLHTYRDDAAYYIKKYNLEGKCNITERGKYMREKNSDIFEEIARNTRNIRNISKSLYVLAYLNFMDYQQKYGIELEDNEIDHLWNLSDMLFSMKDEILK